MFALLGCAGTASAGSMWDAMGLPSAIGGDGPPGSILSPDAKQGLAGSFALGYIATTGNTNTQSLDARLNLNYTSGNWFHDMGLEAQRASSGHDTTVNRLDFDGQSNYLFTQHNYVFAHLHYDRKEFGPYARRTSEAVGYGRRVLGGGDMTLDFEAGLGGRQTHFSNDTYSSSGIVRLGSKYEWQFSDNGSFAQAVAIEAGTENTYTESITSLRANLMKTLAVVVSYTIKHNSEVPPGVAQPSSYAHTNTYTMVSLQYTF
jgi:putative salt-induced outer membrane protein